MVGIDCEWRPTLPNLQQASDQQSYHPVETLQISLDRTHGVFVIDLPSVCKSKGAALLTAPRERVDIGTKDLDSNSAGELFLLDMVGQQQRLTECELLLSEVLESLFANPTVTVVGFGCDADLLRLASSYTNMPCFRQVRRVVDLSTLTSFAFPRQPKKSMNSLAKLCNLLLNANLDKAQQCSAWHVRPLTRAQVGGHLLNNT